MEVCHRPPHRLVHLQSRRFVRHALRAGTFRSTGLGAALLLAGCFGLIPLLSTAAPAGALAPAKGFALIDRMLAPGDRGGDGGRAAREKAAGKLARSGDGSFVAPLTDALFFTPAEARGPLLDTLRTLSGEDVGTGFYDWVELVGRRSDLSPPAGYRRWKAKLFSRIDPRYLGVIDSDGAIRIRPEEIVWGGVRLDGIPALSDPPRMAAEAATKEAGLQDDERVFGLCIGDACHAYPLRYLSWHELVNDVVGGRPIAVSFCTLCGSGVAYAAETADHRRRLFGTSGLLYRSNKLMFDHKTRTLWSNITGEAVVGPLAGPPGEPTARLELLPVVVATWGGWRAEHPGTTVTILDPRRDPRWSFRYEPGAADRARRGVSFPVWRHSDALPADAEIYALRLEDGGAVKAYPVERVLALGVINDRVGSTDVVLVGSATDGAVRAYRRDGRSFRRDDPSPEGSESAAPKRDEDGTLIDQDGGRWRIEETRLVPLPHQAEVEDQKDAESGDSISSTGASPLPRLPGHRALWFGWYGFYPDAALYGTDRP